jgi:hypothetical protein
MRRQSRKEGAEERVLPRGATAKKSMSSGKSNVGMSEDHQQQQQAKQWSMKKMREMVQA